MSVAQALGQEKRKDEAAASGLEVRVDDFAACNWDELISGFDDVSYDQTEAFSSLRWGAGRISQLVLVKGGNVTAGARVVVLTQPGLASGLAYLRGGPFWRRRGTAPDTSLYRAAIKAIRAEYCDRRGHHLVVTPRFHPEFSPLEARMLQAEGFRARSGSPDPCRYFVNLGIDRDRRMESLDQGWRRNLRKALGHGLEITLGDSEADTQRFIDLNTSLKRRKRFHDQGHELLLPELSRALPPKLRPQIALAYHRGQPVAGAALLLAGDVAHYLFGGSDEAMLKLNAGYALQWWLVERLSARGHRWYDLGGESLSEGLRQFKRGLVGREGRIVEANVDYELSGSATGRMVAELVFGVRAAKRFYMKLLNA
ncbi:MAG: lipid II:glycine glycyltransferase FemX [Actinomycetota bacterium]